MNVLGQNMPQLNGFSAFIPAKFPPAEGFSFPDSLLLKASEATRLVGKLDGITQLLPDINFFITMYVLKDAEASSQIEGTHADIMDVFQSEARTGATVPDDVDDITHYVAALNHGIARLGELPLSLRFIRELHERLMQGARSTSHAYPGEFRRTQNWIGGTRPDNASFVPPPVEEMHRALNDLEQYIHTASSIAPIIKAGLLHAQFETIHPFTDGNGRTGRLLVTFFLFKEVMLDQPVLFLSAFFKKHQRLYYARLGGYHDGEIVPWIDFFLDGVIETAHEAIDIVRKVSVLRDRDMLKIQTLSARASESAVMVLPKLYGNPLVTARMVQEWTGFTFQGAQKVIDRFVELGILEVRNVEGAQAQSYLYKDYFTIFIKD